MSDVRITAGDCLNVLPTLAEGSADACVTDPPYGLKFMGWAWDHGVPGVPYWRAVLRVLKPGGYLLAFGGTRTFHRQVCAIEDAGFEVRDTINCLAWVYGQGFPKGKGCLKPAWEPVTLARKPGPKVLPLEIDAGRIGTDDETSRANNGTALGLMNDDSWRPKAMTTAGHSAGRWPPNLVILHHPDCDGDCHPACHADGFPTTTSGAKTPGAAEARDGEVFWRLGEGTPSYADTGSAARFFPQFYYCPKATRGERDAGLGGMPRSVVQSVAMGDKRHGTLPYTNEPREQNPLPRANHHPTVKPLDLMRWLVRLVAAPGETVLDPFMGSGTTGVAALKTGLNFVGCEIDPHYFAVAKRRIDAARLPLFDPEGAAR